MNVDAVQAEHVATSVILLALFSLRQRSPERAYEFERAQARDPAAQFKPRVFVDEKGTAMRVEIEIKASEFFDDFAHAFANLDPKKEALRLRAYALVPCWFVRGAS